jgi:hypothetical protein
MPKPQKHVFVCTQQRPSGHPRSSGGQHGCASVYDEFLWQLQGDAPVEFLKTSGEFW